MSGPHSSENKIKNILDEEDDIFYKLDYLARNEINETKNMETTDYDENRKQNICAKRYNDYMNICSRLQQNNFADSNYINYLLRTNHESGSLIFISNKKQTVNNKHSVTDYCKSLNAFDVASKTKREDSKNNEDTDHAYIYGTKNAYKPDPASENGGDAQVLWRRGRAGSSTDDSDTLNITSVSGFTPAPDGEEKFQYEVNEKVAKTSHENIAKGEDTQEFTTGSTNERISKTQSNTEICSKKKSHDNCTSCKIPTISDKPDKCSENCRQQNEEENLLNYDSHTLGTEKKNPRSPTDLRSALYHRECSDTKLSDKRQGRKCVKCFLCCGRGVFPLSESIRAGLTYSVNPYPRIHSPTLLEPCEACALPEDDETDSSKLQKKDYSRMTKQERKKELQRIYGMRLSNRQVNAIPNKLRRPEWVF